MVTAIALAIHPSRPDFFATTSEDPGRGRFLPSAASAVRPPPALAEYVMRYAETGRLDSGTLPVG
jgi:hypothetical protein